MKTPASADLARRLSATAGSKDRFGSTAAEVLDTAALIAAADQHWDQRAISAFQHDQDIHPKVWGKLVALAKSKNLGKVPPKDLPVSYTALYALVVMKEEELAAALAEGLLQRRAGQGPISSRAILDWTKAYRLRGTGVELEIPLMLVLREDLTQEQQDDLLRALQDVAGHFGAEVLQGKHGLKQAAIKAEAGKARAQEIEEELLRLIATDVLNAPLDLQIQFGIKNALDLIEAPRSTFTGFFQNLAGKVEGAFWKTYGYAYALKIAREFNLSDSRTERYQLKDRLNKAVERWGVKIDGLEAMVAKVLSTYMTR